MNLVTRVEHALDTRSVLPGDFERCACAFLMAQYPTLSPVEGGHDLGRDADIYLAGGDPTKIGRVLITTGDPAANLHNGLKRMREEGLPIGFVVMACLGPASGTLRTRLDEICAKYDVPPPRVFARDWFLPRLVADPAWRELLLGVRGRVGALLERPLDLLDNQVGQPALVGRDADLSLLREALSGGDDVVISGVAGVGKTRLVVELGGEAVFLTPGRHDQPVDDLLLVRPQVVVVDDAHARTADLQALRLARHQEGLSFAIVATTWPELTDAVLEALPDARPVPIGRLDRSDMNTLIEAIGVTGHHARTTVLRQADGRPGWALALCELFISGDGLRVFTGAALATNVERLLRRVTESQTALDALACVAALGYADIDALHTLAPRLGMAPAEVVALMNRLARGGLIDQVERGWQLLPALRAPLVARWFFADTPGRPWTSLREAFPDKALPLADAVIAAAQTGAVPARVAAEEWVTGLPVPSTWDSGLLAVVSSYSTLDEDAARRAVNAARTILAEPRHVEHIAGVELDLVGAAAARQLARAAQLWLLPEAISGLLDLAVDETRPRSRQADDPVRVLADLAGRIDPDFGTDIEVRARLLEAVLAWLDRSPDPRRWLVTAELLRAVFRVEASGSWSEPSVPHTITISRGIEPGPHLERLVALWDRVHAALTTTAKAGPQSCPPEAFAHLVDLAGDWLRLAAGHAPTPAQPGAETRAVAARGAQRIIESLRPHVQPVPGLAYRAHWHLSLAFFGQEPTRLPVGDFDVDPDLRDLVGDLDVHDGYDAKDWLAEQTATIDALAARLAKLGPAGGTARLRDLLGQAALAGEPTDGGLVADRMAPHLAEPAAWFHAAAAASVPSLLTAALTRCLDDPQVRLPDDAVAAVLEDESMRAGVLAGVLRRNRIDDTAEVVLQRLRAADAQQLAWLFARDTADGLLHRLLEHPIPAIAGAAAVSFTFGDRPGPALPDAWQQRWADVVVGTRAEDLASHSRGRLGDLLEDLARRNPDLFTAWFTRRLDETEHHDAITTPRPRGCEAHLAHLPSAQRERLARRCAGLRGGPRLLRHLLGRDRDLARRLLDEGVVTTAELLEVIEDQRHGALEQIGPLLLDHGVSPTQIARRASHIHHWVGSESAAHQRLLDYFDDLARRVPALTAVAEAGRREQIALRDAASAREQRERTRLW